MAFLSLRIANEELTAGVFPYFEIFPRQLLFRLECLISCLLGRKSKSDHAIHGDTSLPKTGSTTRAQKGALSAHWDAEFSRRSAACMNPACLAMHQCGEDAEYPLQSSSNRLFASVRVLSCDRRWIRSCDCGEGRRSLNLVTIQLQVETTASRMHFLKKCYIWQNLIKHQLKCKNYGTLEFPQALAL